MLKNVLYNSITKTPLLKEREKTQTASALFGYFSEFLTLHKSLCSMHARLITIIPATAAINAAVAIIKSRIEKLILSSILFSVIAFQHFCISFFTSFIQAFGILMFVISIKVITAFFLPPFPTVKILFEFSPVFI